METKQILITQQGCRPCEVAKRKYKDEIEKGEIEVQDINEVDDRTLVAVFERLREQEGYIGVPAIAKVEGRKVLDVQLGLEDDS